MGVYQGIFNCLCRREMFSCLSSDMGGSIVGSGSMGGGWV